jgi:uracil-DNA glycosylase
MSINPQIHASWLAELKDEFTKPYFLQLKQFLLEEKNKGHKIYPPRSLIFNAFNSTPLRMLKL